MNKLDKLLYLRGVSSEYFDYSGNLCQVDWEDRLRLLRALGYNTEDQEGIDQAIDELDASPWTKNLRDFYIMQEASCFVDVHSEPQALNEALSWLLVTEDGANYEGHYVPNQLAEVGEYYIGPIRYSAHRLVLPDLPAGYHRLDVFNAQKRESTELIVSPEHCFQPLSEDQNERAWGISCQLYTLRSTRNWGIGDFSDLHSLIDLASSQGADVIGLNPLHAPFLDGPDYASPYSPSDRRFINPIYIDPEIIEEYQQSPSVKAYVLEEKVQQELRNLRATSLVNYDGVNSIKYDVLGKLYQQFVLQDLEKASKRAGEFKAFVIMQGSTLREFSEFECKQNHFAKGYESGPQFFQYLQWIACQQLNACQLQAKENGMSIGLMGDLAVGSIANGFEVKQNPLLFNTAVTIGAPPDPLASEGQNWNLPVLDPVFMREQKYQFFIELLRSNMSAYGALRIDHVMGLMRLWWCITDSEHEKASGAYVYYSFDHLMAILRLESQRNQCMVIGEDMGVVPVEVSQAMHESKIYSNNVLYFEQYHDGHYKHPNEQQVDAVLFVTNHDVSTLAGWWNGGDISKREQLDLINSETARHQHQHRRYEKQQLLIWLQQQELLSASWGAESIEQAFDIELCTSIHQACSRSKSRLMLLQLEDLQLIEDPVNIPGTYREYPNWRRKQEQSCDQLFSQQQVQHLLGLVNQERMT